MVARLEDLVAGVTVDGVDPAGSVQIVAVQWHGTEAVTLVHRDDRRQVADRLLYRSDEGTFSI